MDSLTVLLENDELNLEGILRNEMLWAEQSLLSEMGWHLEDRGICRDEQCIPVPGDGTLINDGFVNLAEFVDRTGRIYNDENDPLVAAIGPADESLREAKVGGTAPDFELPDSNGDTFRLSDFEGSKIFLLVWASW